MKLDENLQSLNINIDDLTYREKSLAIVVDEDKNFLIDQLIDYGENDWNFPGGGIDEGESPKEAVFRELFEELGTDKFKILKKSKEVIEYAWPKNIIIKRFKKEGKTYKGQRQHIFLVEFTGSKADIRFDSGEIRKIKWLKYEELENHLNFPKQWEIIEKVLKDLF